MAVMAAKLLGYGVHVHINQRTFIILANTSWAAQQTWGADISIAHRKIVLKYIYNHSHDADSIHKGLQILATVDITQDQRNTKVPG